MAGDLVVTFESLKEISLDAKAIVVVDIRSVSNQTKGSLPYTIADATVRESLAGDLTVGQAITVGELGGPIRGINKETGALGDSQVMAPGGAQPLTAGKSYLLFLGKPTNIGPVSGGAYAPRGAFQGKLLLTNGLLKFDGDRSALSSGDGAYSVARALDGRKWGEVRAEILAILAKK